MRCDDGLLIGTAPGNRRPGRSRRPLGGDQSGWGLPGCGSWLRRNEKGLARSVREEIEECLAFDYSIFSDERLVYRQPVMMVIIGRPRIRSGAGSEPVEGRSANHRNYLKSTAELKEKASLASATKLAMMVGTKQHDDQRDGFIMPQGTLPSQYVEECRSCRQIRPGSASILLAVLGGMETPFCKPRSCRQDGGAPGGVA